MESTQQAMKGISELFRRQRLLVDPVTIDKTVRRKEPQEEEMEEEMGDDQSQKHGLLKIEPNEAIDCNTTNQDMTSTAGRYRFWKPQAVKIPFQQHAKRD